MSREVIIYVTCDRCGVKSKKDERPMKDSVTMTIEDRLELRALGDPKVTLTLDLCGECNKELRAFLNSKKEKP